MRHIFTEEQGEFLRKNVKGRKNEELTEIFNRKFKTSLKVTQITSYKKNHGLKSGLGKFKKGHTPWNKGMKGLNIGGKETQFKKGNIPHNYKLVGSERIAKDGYIEIKVADPNVWIAKHRHIWEQHNGPTPKGHIIIFGDGNNRNFNIDNLICVSREQQLRLNQYGLIKNNADLTKVGINIVNLKKKINERKEG